MIRPSTFRSLSRPAGLALLILLGNPGEARGAPGDVSVIFGTGYPIEAVVSQDAALFHWVDSLAGSSVGKTIPAHRREFRQRFGSPTPEDVKVLQAFQAARTHHARGGSGRGLSPMLGAFLSSMSQAEALDKLRLELTATDRAAIEAALRHFRTRFEVLWEGGRIPRAFLQELKTSKDLDGLDRLLVRMRRMFGVDAGKLPRPRLVLMPVLDGYGTHAQAVGRDLLVEVRPAEPLASQASVIVHENAHLLFEGMGSERLTQLARVARSQGPSGEEAWGLLKEALPTALGQGVAARAFGGAQWSERSPWYHTDDVDAYAKTIYPLVSALLESGGEIDEGFVRKLAAIHRDVRR